MHYRSRLPLNIPNDQAVALYPSSGLFEGTIMRLSGGTPFPFQVIGYPASDFGSFHFMPLTMTAGSSTPMYENQTCFGMDLRDIVPPKDRLDLRYLLQFYKLAAAKGLGFFGPTFDLHAGNDLLRQQIKAGLSEAAIRASWQAALAQYKARRKKYLLYE